MVNLFKQQKEEVMKVRELTAKGIYSPEKQENQTGQNGKELMPANRSEQYRAKVLSSSSDALNKTTRAFAVSVEKYRAKVHG